MAKGSKQVVEADRPLPPSIFGEPVEDLDEEEVNELAEQPEFDIFEDIGAKLAAASDLVTYTVKQNGIFKDGALPHPQSWDSMRKRYGGGTLQVILRSQKKGGYVKSQTRNLAPLEADEEIEAPALPTPPASGSTQTELFMLMNQMKREEREENQRQIARMEQERREREEKMEREAERKEREAREREERRVKEEEKKQQEALSTNQMMMTMMFKMMETQSANTAAMITALMTGQKEKKEDLSLNEIMRLMDSRMEKTIALLKDSKSKGEPTVAEQVKMMMDAEDRGYKKARDVQKMAEEKAEELAELREAGGVKPGPQEPSTAKMLIESVVPAVQALVASRLGGMEAPPAQPAPTQTAPALPPRLPLTGPGTTPALPPPPAKVIVKAPQVPQAPQAPAPGGIRPGSAVRVGAQAPVATKPPVQTQNVAPSKPAAPPQAAPKAPESKGVVTDMSKRELVEKITIEEIGKDLAANLLTGKFQPEKTADTCVQRLKPFGVDEIYLSSQFTLDDMMGIARANKMPDAIKPYLERFHAHITSKATVGAGQSASNAQPGNT